MTAYTTYRAIDFARNECFQQWILQSTPEATVFWECWLKEHPDKKAEVEEARQLILMLGRREQVVEERQARRMKQHIFAHLPPTSLAEVPKKPRRWPVWAAACLLVLLLGGLGRWTYRQWAYVTYATDYGEKQELTLPDGSQITLKANSRLRHSRDWNPGHEREVWLDGEAFFHVKKTLVHHDKTTKERAARYAKFVVHATAVVDIAVLGTEFNVNTREDDTEIVLKSGSVQVEIKQDEQQKMLLMKPGDLVEVKQHQRKITQKQVDPHVYVAWKENMLIFDELTLSAVARKLEYAYGVDIVFQDSTLARRKFKGFVPADNLDVLLEAFTELYGIQIKKTDNQIIIQ